MPLRLYAGKMIELDPDSYDVEELRAKKHTIDHPAYDLIVGHGILHVAPEFKPEMFHGTVPLDCDGDPIPTGTWGLRSDGNMKKMSGGMGWWPHYACLCRKGVAPGVGIIVDRRKFWDILMGCCPKWQLD